MTIIVETRWPAHARTMEGLRRDGIATLEPMTPGEARDLREYFLLKPAFNWHVKAKATELPVPACEAIAQRRWPAFCHDMADVVAAPHLFELAVGSHHLAREYFGEPPRLYSMNAFWTQPVGGQVHRDTHGWHRDGDDRKQLVVFAFATDVPEALHGGHLYQRGTHLIEDHALGRDFRAPPGEIIEIITGPAGTTFCADTKGLHLGVPPRDRPRLLLWARWGVSDPPASYGWDQLSPAPRDVLGSRYPEDPELREAVRLVVA